MLLKTLSRRTVLHAHRCLSRVLADAVALGTLGRNFAAVRRPPAVEDDELVILDRGTGSGRPDLSDGGNHSLYPVVALALATGMRRGELLALEWRDIDLDAGTLRVERNLEETKAGLRVKSPKTKRGRRKIALPAESVSMLRDHRKRQIELRLALGQGGQPTLVSSTLEGRHIKPNSVTRDWSRLPQEAAQGQIPRLEAHSRLAVDRRRR